MPCLTFQTLSNGEISRVSELAIGRIDVEVTQVSIASRMWTLSQPDESESMHNELTNSITSAAPRKLHSSISSPAVSALKYDYQNNSSTTPSTTTSHHAILSSSSSQSSPLVPRMNVLKPYESLIQFFRVTNLPNTFALPPNLHDKPVHTSASANNLASERMTNASVNSSNVTANAHRSALLSSAPHVSSVPLVDSANSLDVIDSSSPPIAYLLQMEKALMIEEEKQTLIVNPAAVVAEVGAPNRLDLILSWRSVDGTRFGVLHQPGLACMKASPSACALKVLLSYPRTCSLPFPTDANRSSSSYSHAPLDVPVTISIRNTLEDATVSFFFETLPSEEEFDPIKRTFRVHHSQSLRGRYTWAGATKCKINDLPPGEQVQIDLFAAFPAPGVYNLNRFRFTVEQVGKKPRIFFFPLQHLIHVNQSDPNLPSATPPSHSNDSPQVAHLNSSNFESTPLKSDDPSTDPSSSLGALDAVEELEQPIELDGEGEGEDESHQQNEQSITVDSANDPSNHGFNAIDDQANHHDHGEEEDFNDASESTDHPREPDAIATSE